jgi:hypothetical protein
MADRRVGVAIISLDGFWVAWHATRGKSIPHIAIPKNHNYLNSERLTPTERLRRLLMRTFVTCSAMLATIAFAGLAAKAAVIGTVDAGAFDVESGHGDFHSDSTNTFTTTSAAYSNPEGGGASAFATVGMNANGGVVLKAYASGSAGDVVSNRGSASASWQDDVHFTGSPLEILVDLKFEIDGSTSGDGTMSASGVACIGNTCGEPHFLDGPGYFNLNPTFLVPRDVPVTISYDLSVTAAGIAIVGPASSTSDFSHSMSLVSIIPHDAQGNIITGITLVSASGIDYNPLLITNQVPEPGTLVLWAALFAPLGAFIRLRRR